MESKIEFNTTNKIEMAKNMFSDTTLYRNRTTKQKNKMRTVKEEDNTNVVFYEFSGSLPNNDLQLIERMIALIEFNVPIKFKEKTKSIPNYIIFKKVKNRLFKIFPIANFQNKYKNVAKITSFHYEEFLKQLILSILEIKDLKNIKYKEPKGSNRFEKESYYSYMLSSFFNCLYDNKNPRLLPREFTKLYKDLGLLNRCTYGLNKKNYIKQEYFSCVTCWGDDMRYGACSYCSETCHKGHHLVPISEPPKKKDCKNRDEIVEFFFSCYCGKQAHASLKCSRNNNGLKYTKGKCFLCRDCFPGFERDDIPGVCANCSEKCHSGHNIEQVEREIAFICNCGLKPSISKCKAS